MATIVVAQGMQIAHGQKTAILTPATPADQYRMGGQWQRLADSGWQHGREVEAVNHFQQHQHAVGDTLSIRALETMQIECEARILRIRMVDGEKLGPGEVAALGYPDSAAYEREWGRAVTQRRAWLMDISLIEGAQH